MHADFSIKKISKIIKCDYREKLTIDVSALMCYNSGMNTTDLAIAIALALLVVIVLVVLLVKVGKLLYTILAFVFKPVVWFIGLFAPKKKPAKEESAKAPRYKSLADFATKVESDPKEIDANIYAIFSELSDELGKAMDETKDDSDRAILSEPVAALRRIANAKIADKNKPVIGSLFELADLVEEKKVKIDPAIRAMLTEVYDYCELFGLANDEDCDISATAYDIERALYPKGPSQSQAEASAKRQSKIDAAIKARMKKTAPV